MEHRYNKHYTREEASALLPLVRDWLDRLLELREQVAEQEAKVSRLAPPGQDTGGVEVNEWVRLTAEIQGTLFEFYRREIQIKDLDRGLVDFPALLDGREVFLCWEKSEPDIAFWHDLEAGYAGRRPIEDQ